MKIRYAVFDYGGILGKTHFAISCELEDAARRGIPMRGIYMLPDALIYRNRSRVVGVFLQNTEDDVLVMVDRDIVFERGALIELASIACRRKSVVAGIYAKKNLNDGLAGTGMPGEVLRIGDQAAKEVEGFRLATGFMAIHRSVLEECAPVLDANGLEMQEKILAEMKTGSIDNTRRLIGLSLGTLREVFYGAGIKEFHAWFAPWQQRDEDNKFLVELGEDYAFCERVRFCGKKIYLAPQFRLGHIGDFTFYPEHAGRGEVVEV